MHTYKVIMVSLALVILVSAGRSTVAQTAPENDVPSVMAKLEYLIGAWQATPEFLDKDGNVSGTGRAEGSAERLFGGLVIQQYGKLFGVIEARSWYFYDQETDKLTFLTVDSEGSHHRFTGGFQNGKLILISEAQQRSDGRTVMYKRIDENLTEGSFDTSMFYSVDGGQSWTLANRQTNRKRGTDVQDSEIMKALATYVGGWKTTKLMSARDGSKYRHGYVLEYFDSAKTMVKMTITREFENGQTDLLWSGFKGWNSVNKRVFYQGFSPSARAARGFLWLDPEGRLVTEYEGHGPNGNPVHIKDVFEKKDHDNFHSITYIHRDGSWVVIMEEDWQRVSS